MDRRPAVLLMPLQAKPVLSGTGGMEHATTIEQSRKRRLSVPAHSPPCIIVTTSELRIGSWVCAPLFGKVVAIHETLAANDIPRAWIRDFTKESPSEKTPLVVLHTLEGTETIPLQCNSWSVFTFSEQAASARGLAGALGRFLKAHERGDEARLPVGCATGWDMRLPKNMDRLRAFWIALRFEHILASAEAAKAIHSTAITLPLRKRTIEAPLRAALYLHILGQLHYEMTSAGRDFERRLCREMRHATRRWLANGCRGSFKDLPACRKIVSFARTHHPPAWIRISHYVSRRRCYSRWFSVLEYIAEDDLAAALAAFLFAIQNHRYYWKPISTGRLAGLIALLRRYAANRAAPQGSPLRIARGRALMLIDSFSQSDIAMSAQAKVLGMESLTINLLDGKILANGFEHYRHTHLAGIAANIFSRGIAQILSGPINYATLRVQFGELCNHYEIEVRCADGRRLVTLSP